METTVAELRELGLETAANDLERKLEFKRKLLIAYENFRFVSPVVIERFQNALKAKTLKEWSNKYGKCYSYDRLCFIDIKNYKDLPPQNVLESMRKAKALNCFDGFDVAKLETVTHEATAPKPDPIIFGKINGCADIFFIDQWDDDVKIDDILGKTEG